MRNLLRLCAVLTCVVSLHVYAAPMSSGYQTLQQQWDIANFGTQEPKARKTAFEALVSQAHDMAQANPDNAEILIWQGIILSTYAGEKGGLGALSLVKEAKVSFEKSLAINPASLNGSAHTSLGSLYYQVPGWPISFGDDKLAEQQLLEGLKLAPNDIDALYFYGDFLTTKKRYADAITTLQKAQAAPARPGRELADIGRRVQIKTLLKKNAEKNH